MPGAKVFLSYKHQRAGSEGIRRQLEAELIQHGYTVLVDETLRGGERWPTRLYEWVLECAAAVVLASPEAKASEWCQREWPVLAARAAASSTRVIPVCLNLPPSELAVLEGLQAIEAGDDLVPRVLAALRDPFEESHGGRTSLVDAVIGLVLDPGFRDAIVVQGPAGSGKSAFTLRLAYELITQGLQAVRLGVHTRFVQKLSLTYDTHNCFWG